MAALPLAVSSVMALRHRNMTVMPTPPRKYTQRSVGVTPCRAIIIPTSGVSRPQPVTIRLRMPNTRARCDGSTSSMTSRLHDTDTMRPVALRIAASTKAVTFCAKAQTNIGRVQETRSPMRVVRLRPALLVIGAATS